MHERMLEIDGHRIAVISGNEEQAGVPVILIHGITASVDFWLPTLPLEIRDHRRWHSLSLPGHAPSTMPAGYRREQITESMFSDVLGQAIHLLTAGQPAHLVGWSTGSFSALAIAARHPKLVRSVASFSGFARGSWLGSIGLLQILAATPPLGGVITRHIFRRLGQIPWLHEFTAIRAAANPRAVRQSAAWQETFPILHQAMTRHDPAVMTDLFVRLRTLNISAQLPKISVPVLIAGGNHDPYIPFAQTQFLAEQIPGAELVVLDRIGHMFFAECTDLYHTLLTDWLTRQEVAEAQSCFESGQLQSSTSQTGAGA